ncbi:MAG: hypothetical protein OXT64_04205 [Gammaproteobacteria bacterium]|nr:hypothetical protein [Gammaproteobacteria bacterium]MDE0450146.1 hypothetical protein [Gammaproteobacteria bacterium]
MSKRTVKVLPESYQPSQDELNEDLRIPGVSFQDLIRSVLGTATLVMTPEEVKEYRAARRRKG